MIKIIKGYWLEILLGGILLIIDIKLFLFFFFIIYLISSEKRTDYLRKLMRVFHIHNEMKLLAIMDKLGVTEEETKAKLEEMENSMTEEAVTALENDFKSVTNFNNLK